MTACGTIAMHGSSPTCMFLVGSFHTEYIISMQHDNALCIYRITITQQPKLLAPIPSAVLFRKIA